MARRPLSPHVFIYRFGYTMSLSILHRITGVALSIALLLFTALLVAAASGPASWEQLTGWLPGWVFKLLAAPVVVAFVYHLANGVRHLFWDAGFGFERAQARRSGAIVVLFTVLVGGALLWVLASAGGGAP